MAQKWAVIHVTTGSVIQYGFADFSSSYNPVTESLVQMNRDSVPPDGVPLYYVKTVSGSPFSDFIEMSQVEKDLVDSNGISPPPVSNEVTDFVDVNAHVVDAPSGMEGPFEIMQPLVNRRELYNDNENPLYLPSGFMPVLGVNGWGTDHSNRINNLEVIHGKTGWHNRQIVEASYIRPKDLLIYYGWVNSFNYGVNAWSNELVAQDMARYGVVVLGDGLQQLYDLGLHTGASNASVLTDSTKSWTPDEHVGKMVVNTTDGSVGSITANTANTITASLTGGTDNDWDTGDSYEIRHADYISLLVVVARIIEINPNTLIFGYVSVNQDLSIFQSKVNDWNVVQIHGIFMDESGYDYGITREEFNSRVDYVHARTYANLCFVNSWNMDHVIGTADDVGFPNTTYNPGLIESNLTANDWYLLESFPVNTTSYSGSNGYEAKADWFFRGNKAVTHRFNYGINLASAAIINNANGSAQALFDFQFISSIMFALEAVGSSDDFYGASSATVTFWTRPDITGLGRIWSATSMVREDAVDSDVYWRYVDFGRFMLDFSSSAESSGILKW